MSMPPESVFPGSGGMPPEAVFPGITFHHPDHNHGNGTFWQQLQIWERAILVIFFVVFTAEIFYRVIYPRIIQLWHSPQAMAQPLPAAIELQPPPV